jgi:hypothetical protein
MSPVIDREFIEEIGTLLRAHVQAQNKVLFEVLREYKTAQFSALEEALGAHLKAQSDMVDRLLGRLEALFRAPSGEPEAGRRLDS